MNIKIKTEREGQWAEISVAEGTTLKALADIYQKELPYRIILARVNGFATELTEQVTEGTDVELIDRRDHSADLAYQRGLSMVYVHAVRRVMNKDVLIDYSINKGFFTRILQDEEVTGEQVELIEKEMRNIVDRDAAFERDGREYVLEGYHDCYFGIMPPSTGYIREFALMKYRDGVLLRYPDCSKPDEMTPYDDQYKLQAAFDEAHEWGRLMKAEFLDDVNETVRKGEAGILILMAEAFHEKKLAETAEKIAAGGKRIILVAGPSSSGKTTFSRRLSVQLRVHGLRPIYMGTDDYFLDRENAPRDEKGEYRFEDLDALDLDLFNRDINNLLAGEMVDMPVFDFIEGKKKFGTRLTKIEKDQPIIIEGIHALNEKLTEHISPDELFRIYICPLIHLNMNEHVRIPTADARLIRRMVRDYKYRAHSPSKTIKGWSKVREGESRNIFPYSNSADVIFNSALVYEQCLLKKYAVPLLESVDKDDEMRGRAEELLQFLENFETIEEDNCVLNNSIMREFIGGSVFGDL